MPSNLNHVVTEVSIESSVLKLSEYERKDWCGIGGGSRAVILTDLEIAALKESAAMEFDPAAAARLRSIVNRLGVAAPESNVDMMGALFSVLGNIERALNSVLPIKESLAADDRLGLQPGPVSRLQSIIDRVAEPVAARERDIITLAQRNVCQEGKIEIDDSSIVSEGDDNGAYVLAWVWCDFEGSPMSKSDDPTDSEDDDNA